MKNRAGTTAVALILVGAGWTIAFAGGVGDHRVAGGGANECITFVDYQQWLQLYRGFVPPRSSNPYFFTGRRLDFDIRSGSTPEFTLYHYRARAYDPWHGRFCQRDPALYRESLNLYLYALSNPLRFTDSTGRYNDFQGEIDNLIIDLIAHRIVTLQYISAGAGLAQMGMNASLVMMELYLSFKSPFAGAMFAGYRFSQSPTWLGGLDVAASLGGLGLGTKAIGRLGAYTLRWMRQYSKIHNKGGKAVEEALRIQLHHSIPKFLGGDPSQLLSEISAMGHRYFDARLRDELLARGFPRRLLGGRTGSTDAWRRWFTKYPGSQLEAFDAILEASRYTDAEFGTTLFDDVLENLAENAFTSHGEWPWP